VSKVRIHKVELVKPGLIAWVFICMVGFFLLTLPIIADDLVILIQFTVNTNDKNLFESFVFEVNHQWNNSDSRFLPMGWTISAILLTVSKALNLTGFVDLELSWSLTRLSIIAITAWISWRNISLIQKFHGIRQLGFTKYLILLCLTLQMHALWGHDPIISYTSTVFGLLILTTLYFRLLETKFGWFGGISRIVVLLCLFTIHELSIAVLGYLITLAAIQKFRINIVLRVIPDLVIILCYLLFVITTSVTEKSSYPGTQIGSIFLIPLYTIVQIAGTLPLSTWPLYIYSIFTENFEVASFILGFSLAIPVLLISRFKIVVPEKVVQPKEYYFGIAIFAFLLLLAIGTAMSEKYQTAYLLVPGNTYLIYVFGWILFPFFISLFTRIVFARGHRLIYLVVILNSFILGSSIHSIGAKFEANSKILKQFEVVRAESNCEFLKSLNTAGYPDYYYLTIRDALLVQQPKLKRCFNE
jgi:hypothetical protein